MKAAPCGHQNTETAKLCGRPSGDAYWQDDMGEYPLCDAHAKAYHQRELPVARRKRG